MHPHPPCHGQLGVVNSSSSSSNYTHTACIHGICVAGRCYCRPGASRSVQYLYCVIIATKQKVGPHG